MSNPYFSQHAQQFWRQAVAGVEGHALNPVATPRFRIKPEEKVATAGSCFAQHISRQLKRIGFNYYVPEVAIHLSAAQQQEYGYGVFSARFGNIYTVRQLLQLFEEALGTREKAEIAWPRKDGRFIDAFRPSIQTDGYATVDEVISARLEHLLYVRKVFCDSDIFIFTLGLTESWMNRASGDIFPLAPGVAGGLFSPSEHSFKNMRVDEVSADLETFLVKLKKVNPKVRVLLTVSPVPLIATFENRHVLVSNTYSKSVLRVASEAAIERFSWVDYFPSYEIITGNFNMGRYYEEDLRSVNSAGVGHAMRCFLHAYTESTDYISKKIQTVVADNGVSPGFGDVICDEELIDRMAR